MAVAVTSVGPWPALGAAQAARQAVQRIPRSTHSKIPDRADCRRILKALEREDTMRIGPLEIIFILFVAGSGLAALIPILTRNRRK
jgi:hypothetical protein